MLLLAEEPQLFLHSIRRIVARVECHPAILRLGDLVDGLIQQEAIVGDQDHGPLKVADDLFQASLPLQVQMVVGLVKKQQVRLAGQQLGQADHLLLATRQRAGRLMENLLGEAQPLQRLASSALVSIATHALEPLLSTRIAGHNPLQRGVIGRQRRVGHALLQGAERPLHAHQIARGAQRFLPHSPVGIQLRLLSQMAYSHLFVANDRTFRSNELPGDDAQERGLADTVRPNQADLAPRLYLPAQSLQHSLRTIVVSDSIHTDDDHGELPPRLGRAQGTRPNTALPRAGNKKAVGRLRPRPSFFTIHKTTGLGRTPTMSRRRERGPDHRKTDYGQSRQQEKHSTSTLYPAHA